mmetsp:Transcript_32562/g.31794  ORF Transcript_32562/g.31794 Transcript_32562/m.31794 type:complete len:134 (+) Transcript_32562:582-983(+)
MTLAFCCRRMFDVIMVEEFNFLSPCKLEGLSAVLQDIHTVLGGIGGRPIGLLLKNTGGSDSSFKTTSESILLLQLILYDHHLHIFLIHFSILDPCILIDQGLMLASVISTFISLIGLPSRSLSLLVVLVNNSL